MDTSLPLEMRTQILDSVSVDYPHLGVTYSRPRHEIRYSPVLTRSDQNYYDSKTQVQEDYRMSTAAEELAIQLAIERAGGDPRDSNVFNGLFLKGGDETNYAWQWTGTALRVPIGWEDGRYDEKAEGYPRIVLIGDTEVGEVIVPIGKGRIVLEWDEVYGIPKTTAETTHIEGDNDHTAHFWFRENPQQVDDVSGQYDIAVVRRSDQHPVGSKRCFAIRADWRRSINYANECFRQVQGRSPQIPEQSPIS